MNERHSKVIFFASLLILGGCGLGDRVQPKAPAAAVARSARIQTADDAIGVVRRDITQHGGDPNAAEYRASRREGQWFVTVSEIPGRPGGHTSYSITGDGKIAGVFPGK